MLNRFQAIFPALLLLFAYSLGESRDPIPISYYENANFEETVYHEDGLVEPSEAFGLDNNVEISPNGEVRPIYLNQAQRPNRKMDQPLHVIPAKKIIGGIEANSGLVPYQIAIKDDFGELICGGAIFNKNSIITASHCFFEMGGKVSQERLNKFTFVAGKHNIKFQEKSEQIGIPSKIILHPNYKSEGFTHDIAIVKLKTEFKYTYHVQPISIGKPPVEAVAGEEAQISGWGYTKKRNYGEQFDDLYYPSKLRYAATDIESKKKCVNAYRGNRLLAELASDDKNFVCAGTPNGIDSCRGDSGGPLACYDPNRANKKFLCGVVCTGVGCGVPGYPGFYTRVSTFQQWILKNAGLADAATRRY